jgi:hypothetical protein
MAEGRMLKKRIAKSRKFARLQSDKARLLYLMVLPHLDVEGRLEAEPDLLKADVLPLLRWSLKTISKALTELHEVGLINLYTVNGNQYLEYANFDKFQTLRQDREKSSKLPIPGGLQEDSRSTPALREGKGKGREDKIREGKGSVPLISSSPSSRLLFDTELRKIISPKSKSDIAAFRNLIMWSESQGNQSRVLQVAKKAKGKEKPISMFFYLLKEELGYRPRGKKGKC